MKFAQKLLNVSFGLLAPAFILLGPIQMIAIPMSQTTSQTKVPGTTVSITPPEGFNASKLFTGFEQSKSGASIMVTEFPVPRDASHKILEKLSSANAFKAQGIRSLSSQDTTIDGHRGKLLLLSQELRGTTFLKWVAVLVKGDRALMIVAPFPESQSLKLREPLRQAILSLKWQPNQPITPKSQLEGLPFTFQEQGDLKIAGRMSNTVLLTKNAVQPPTPASDPLVVVGVAYQETLIPDIAQFSRKRLKQVAQIRNLTEVSGDRKTIAGQKAFEIVAEAKDVGSNTPLMVYQVIITTDKTYYIVQGFAARTDMKKYLPIFRSIADSIKPNL